MSPVAKLETFPAQKSMKTITKLLIYINIKQLIDSIEHQRLKEYLNRSKRQSTFISIKKLRILKLIAKENENYLNQIIHKVKSIKSIKIYIHGYYIKQVVTPYGTAHLIMVRFKLFKNGLNHFTFSPFPKDILPGIKYRITEVINVLQNKYYSDDSYGTMPYHNRDFDELELEEITGRMLDAYTVNDKHTRSGLILNLIIEAYYKYVHAGAVFRRYLHNYSTQELLQT